MIKVFTDAGYTQKRSFEDGAVRLHLDLEPTDRALAVQRAREQRAEARSVQRLLAPGSIAVIGAGRTPGGVGRTVLRNILESGYTGRVHAVNTALPDVPTTLDGVPAYRSVTGIGEPVDLAVVAVPADHVPSVVAECGDHGVRGLVVLSAGYAESGPAGRERQRALVRQARSYGMRVIGPNAFGILNTADDVRLNASLAPQLPAAGRIGLFTQSGAIGIALLAGLHRRGAGVSSFVSAGNRADVSGNDIPSTGTRTPAPTSSCCTWSRSAIPASSRGWPAAPPWPSPWWPSRADATAAARPRPRRAGHPRPARHGLRAAAPGGCHPRRHRH